MDYSNLFDERFSVAVLSADAGVVPELLPEEEACLGAVVSKRREEFSLGRAAARQAFKKIGINEQVPVLCGEGREPLWPEGVIGSITHCNRTAVTVVTKEEEIVGIGIDLESLDDTTRTDVSPRVCTERELAWLEGCAAEKNRALLSLFSAKETIYKAFYPIT